MPLPELVRKSAEKALSTYCRDKVPACVQGQLRLAFNIRDDHVTLFEEKAPLGQVNWLATPVAQFRFSHDLNQWTLHYPGRDRKWHFYLNAGPALDIGKLLRHLDADPLHMFWS